MLGSASLHILANYYQPLNGALAINMEIILQDIYSLSDIPNEYTDDPKFESELMTKYIGALAGSEKLYINIDSLKPGAKSSKFHSHTLKEEFFIILKGSGKVRINENLFSVKKGDFFSKPAGKGISHQFINDSSDILEILDCGINDKNDIVEYPEENIILVQGKAYEKSAAVREWTSDPNN